MSSDEATRVPIEEVNEQADCVLTSFFDTANSMETWYPPLEGIEVPTPKTHMIVLEGGTQAYLEIPRDELTAVFMTENPEIKMEFMGKPEYSLEELQTIINDKFNGERVFVRSYYKSARHLDKVAGQIEEPTAENIYQTIGALFDDHVMQNMPTGNGIAFREFLDLDFNPDPDVTFEDEPHPTLHPEVRFFIDDGSVKYHWPRMHRDTFEKETGNLEFYHEQVQHIKDNIDNLQKYAERVAERFSPHAWSVDFVMTKDGNWFCTDMAVDALYWNEQAGKWNNMSEHESENEHNLEETIGKDLPAPDSPPNGFPAWRDPLLERN